MHVRTLPRRADTTGGDTVRPQPVEAEPLTGPDRVALIELTLRAGVELEDASASDIITWAVEHFGRQWCVASSMADALLPHLASSVLPGVDVVFLDTGFQFAETIGTRDAVAATMPVNVRTIPAPQSVAEQAAEFGPDLFRRNPDLCCALRKVAPLARALVPYRAWASGLRRADSPARAGVQVVEWDARRNMVKINPIAAWTDEDVERYVRDNNVLVNPLLHDGYGSVGCTPCTRRLRDGESVRDGRWSGSQKTECGLHG